VERSAIFELFHSDGSSIREELAYKVVSECEWGADVEIEMPKEKFSTDGWKDDVYLTLRCLVGKINHIFYVTK
jgi:hypothetical protein